MELTNGLAIAIFICFMLAALPGFILFFMNRESKDFSKELLQISLTESLKNRDRSAKKGLPIRVCNRVERYKKRLQAYSQKLEANGYENH